MNTHQLTKAISDLKFPQWHSDPAKFKADRKFWGEEISKLEKEWKEWLGERYASDINTSGRELIFSRAWQDAHSSGYYEVEGTYEDLADFGRAFLSAAI